MGRVLFYHLTRSPAEALVPRLITRAMQQGWRVELRGTDPGLLARLDDGLWMQEGFLAHAMAGGGHDARQPILLRLLEQDAPPDEAGAKAANGASCILSLDGAPVGADLAAEADRVCILFDGHDPVALDRARAQWRELAAAGQGLDYWSEASGRWHKERSSDGG